MCVTFTHKCCQKSLLAEAYKSYGFKAKTNKGGKKWHLKMIIPKIQMLHFVIKLCSKTDITPADLKLGHVTVMRLLIAKLLSIANCSMGE